MEASDLSPSLQEATLARQREQYEHYIRLHQLRAARGGGSRSSSSRQLSPAAGHSAHDEVSDAEYHQSHEGDELAGDVPHQLPPVNFHERAAQLVVSAVGWSDLTRRSACVLAVHLALGVAMATWLLIVGAHHQNDDFSPFPPDPVGTANTENTCARLPLFLIVTGSMVLVAIVTIATLITLTAREAQNKLHVASLPCLMLLFFLAFVSFIWLVIGTVWTFTARDLCDEELRRTSAFTVIAGYVVTVMQLCLSCFRRCCKKDVLPV